MAELRQHVGAGNPGLDCPPMQSALSAMPCPKTPQRAKIMRRILRALRRLAKEVSGDPALARPLRARCPAGVNDEAAWPWLSRAGEGKQSNRSVLPPRRSHPST